MKTPVNISVISDTYSNDYRVMFSSYVNNKYSLCFDDIRIKQKDFNTVVSKIKKLDEFSFTHFPLTLFNDFYVLESDNFLLTFDTFDNKKQVIINLFFQTWQQVKQLFDVISEFSDRDDELSVNIISFYIDKGSLSNNENKKVFSDFEEDKISYYPCLDVDELFKQFMMSQSNILLLCGKPGTGKTRLGNYFMKTLLEKSEQFNCPAIHTINTIEEEHDDHIVTKTFESKSINVAYIKNEEILSRDDFWIRLKEDEYNIVFLDDLDFALLPRSQNVTSEIDLNKNKFISNLLSFTDGIFNSGNKTKFIITTNRDVQDIDSAVLRKGRTFDILNLRDLSNSEAMSIWKENELDETLFDTMFKGTRVLQSDLGAEISMALKCKGLDMSVKPYVLEDNISLYSKSKSKKKLGI